MCIHRKIIWVNIHQTIGGGGRERERESWKYRGKNKYMLGAACPLGQVVTFLGLSLLMSETRGISYQGLLLLRFQALYLSHFRGGTEIMEKVQMYLQPVSLGLDLEQTSMHLFIFPSEAAHEPAGWRRPGVFGWKAPGTRTKVPENRNNYWSWGIRW